MSVSAQSVLLPVVLSLLTSAATAYAECAWARWASFAWERTCSADGTCRQEPHTSWRYQDAFESKAECDKAKAQGLSNLVRSSRDGSASVVPESGGLRIVDKDGSVFVMRLHCVPDSIDPRGPKGK
jgi:hypothetical protein